ncbi:DUF1190 domain-containing protein [Roseiterribacter gracilis]|uniref:DUF1190 domain-containing protein n=1 Tax=Roseiterribacter gracilis TaxID=2812848 RepID=A0A8S8X6L7_9PROT|nr:hypothetical protein TMPK1_07000 [Rhodospirillales bacterium TMPK1]
MRRSRSIALLFMAAAPIALTACDDSAKKPTPVGSFASPAACRESGQFTDEQCNAALRDAQAQHETRAPRYESREACEAEHGAAACEPRERNGQSWFMPALAGFMIGRALSGGGMMPSAPLYGSASCGSGLGQRACASGSSGAAGGFRTATGAAVSPGVTTMPAAAAASTVQSAAAPARTASSTFNSVERGGLGTRAESGTMGPTGRGAAASAGEAGS